MTLFPAPSILNPTSSPVILAVLKPGEPVLEQLKPEQRAAVIMALLALTLIGLFLIVFAMLGGHWARRLARHRPGKSGKGRGTPVVEGIRPRDSLQTVVPDARTDETIRLGRSPKDTQVDG